MFGYKLIKRFYYMRVYILFLFLFFCSCSSIDLKKPEEEEKPKSIFGDSIVFSTDGRGGLIVKDSNNSSSSLPVNALLWEASLSILDFMSLDVVDAFGGVIVTDWYVNENNNKVRYKTSIYFSSSELKVSSFKVNVIREQLKNGSWVADGSSEALATKIENLILTRAREIRINKK